MVAPPRLAKQCELDGSRARMLDDGVTSPMLQREHMREFFPPHPLWATLLEDAPELTCLGNSLCSFIRALLLLFRRGRFVELLWCPPRLEFVRPVGHVGARGSGLPWHHPVVLPFSWSSMCDMPLFHMT